MLLLLGNRTANAARTAQLFTQAALGSQVRVRITCWDGSEAGPEDAPLQLNLRNSRALRRVMWSPNELGFARAYVSGDLDVGGDFFTGLAQLNRVSDRSSAADSAGHIGRIGLIKDLFRMGLVGPRPRPPVEEVRLGGHAHSRRRDAAAISHHYDVSNNFYSVVLGPSMTYSCAYWEQPAGPDYHLEDAQAAKCRLIATKLGLTEGMRVLDVGCGWGTFAIIAAKEFGASVVGITLSREQAAYARKRIAEEGLSHRIEIRVEDYRDVSDGPYDAISSIGMAEHVGRSHLAAYSATLFALLRPEGRLLNHAISIRAGRNEAPPSSSFIDRYVFPDGELVPMEQMVGAIEGAGFEIRDVESLREHYAQTLRAWVSNLEDHWDEAVALTSEGRARVWRLYMAGCALTFQSGGLGVNQILAVKPAEGGASGFPRTRAALMQSGPPAAAPAGS